MLHFLLCLVDFKMSYAKAVIHLVLIVFVLVSLNFSEARDYHVFWKLRSNPDKMNQWASKMRFLIGDSIEIKYDQKSDSLLQVSEQSYTTCNITNPIKSFNNGDTKIVLDKSGSYYFISGDQGRCQKGEKMKVYVLSAKHSVRGHDHVATPAISPAKSPAPAMHPMGFLAPAPAPSSGVRTKSEALVVLVVVSLVGFVLG